MPQQAAPHRRRRDLRPFIYGALDLIALVLYVLAITKISPNRHPWAQMLLWMMPLAVGLLAAGTIAAAVLKDPKLNRIGWWIAVAGGALQVLVVIILFCLLLMAASFLSGVYGAFGKGAAAGCLGAAAGIVQFCGLLPVFQLKYLMTRGGRRACNLPPLWGRA
jgi:hypothetical protein